MEAVEILVFLGFAVLLGGLVLGFIAGWDYMTAYRDFQKMMGNDPVKGFEKVDKTGFATRLYDFFDECSKSGLNMTLTLYLADSGNLTKTGLFGLYSELGWCSVIQSRENSCGTREDVDMADIALPKVVKINCTGGFLHIR